MRVLVTGACGFLGTAVAERLAGLGHRVRCLVHPSQPGDQLAALGAELLRGDVRDPTVCASAVAGVDQVVHLAGVKNAWSSRTYDSVNATGTRTLLDACAAVRPVPGRFLFVSSQAAAGPTVNGRPRTEQDEPRPLSAYGRSKLRAERCVLSAGDCLPVTVVRPVFVYGPRSPECTWLARSVRRRLFPVGDPHRRLQLLYVDDLVDGVLEALSAPIARGRVYFLTSAEPVTWAELARAAFAAAGCRGRTVRLPLTAAGALLAPVALARRALGLPPGVLRPRIEEAAADWTCSGEAARRDLEFTARVPLEEGLAMTLRWLRRRT